MHINRRSPPPGGSTYYGLPDAVVEKLLPNRHVVRFHSPRPLQCRLRLRSAAGKWCKKNKIKLKVRASFQKRRGCVAAGRLDGGAGTPLQSAATKAEQEGSSAGRGEGLQWGREPGELQVAVSHHTHPKDIRTCATP